MDSISSDAIIPGKSSAPRWERPAPAPAPPPLLFLQSETHGTLLFSFQHKLETTRLARITGNKGNVQQRPTIADEMRQEMIVCSLDDWFQAYQPFEPQEAEINAGFSILSQSLSTSTGLQEPLLLQNSGWKDFPERPSQSKNTENVVFAPLRAISGRIGTINLDHACSPLPLGGRNDESSAPGDNSTVSPGTHGARQNSSSIVKRHPAMEWAYTTEPNRAIPGEQEGSNNEVDGFFHRIIPELGTLALGDVSVVCEYKKHKGTEVVLKVIQFPTRLLMF